MGINKKAFFFILCSLFAASLAGIIVLFCKSVRSLALIVVTAALIVALAVLLIKYFLREASAKMKAIAIPAASVICAVTLFFTVIVGIAPLIIFPVNHSSYEYETLSKMAQEENSRVVAVNAGGFNGWRLKASSVAEGEARPVVLFFMGNGMNSSRTALMFYKDNDKHYAGFSDVSDIVFIDYPGYGINDGVPADDSLREMALAAYDEVASWSTTSEVISFGYSIGTGPATYLASERDVAGLILWAPYASSYDIYNNIMNIFHGPIKIMVRYQMDSYKYIRDVNCPVMIFASDSDELIPFQSSRDLFANAGSSSADFVTVPGLSHGDFLLEDMVLEDSIDFIKKLVSDI